MEKRADQAVNGLFDAFGSGALGQGGSPGILGQGSNLVSGVFDAAACIFSAFIGGGNPNCRGKGEATVPLPQGSDDSDSSQYSYNYTTDKDGNLVVDITLASGAKCNYSLKPQGQDVKGVVIPAAAKQCFAQKG